MSDSEGRRGRFTPLKRLSDDQLAAEAARGEDKAFALLFERLQEPLYRYSLSILGNPEEARDALQSSMLKAYRALRGETREIAARPWLYRIVRNESVSALRGRRPLGELEEAVGVAAAGADVEAASRERLSDLVADLRSLPERQRSALVLRELSGLDYDELGTALDISPNAARQTVFKARVSMQANVEGRTAHCDEVRAAMSKSDGRFRRRRSIQAHLERCPVCTDFATALEHRPRDLAALFPPLPGGVAAGLLGAVVAEGAAGGAGGAGAAAAGGAAAEGAAAGGGVADAAGAGGDGGVGAAAAGAGAGAGAGPAKTGAAATGARTRPRGQRRRGALVPLLLFLLLVAGTVAMAMVLDDGDGGSEPAGDVAQPPAEPRGGGEEEAAPGPGAEEDSGAPDSGPGSDDSTGGASRDRESGSGDDGGGGGGSGDSSGSADGGQDCVKRTEARGASPARDGYSKRAGRIEVEISDCVPTKKASDCVAGSGDEGGSGSGAGGSGEGSGSGSGDEGSGSGSGGEGSGSAGASGSGDGNGRCERATRDGLPITGLQLGLIVGTALLLLGLGLGLRRLSTS